MSASTASANLAPVSGIAGRYASALFELALDAGALETVEGELKPISPADTFFLLEAAQTVVFVPGYGMAVAQANSKPCKAPSTDRPT